MRCLNGETWFLLFPTKRNWREDADISGIETGLQWIVANYKNEGIKSLALPALGCGLGNLEWKQVGPLMCKYLSLLDIPVFIYLPTEKKIPEEFLNPRFLLPR
jgi:O-acetyl-ADP-ribose deacetylase (regulator of RNase III)